METTTTRGRGRPQAEFQNQIPASLFDDSAFCSLNALQRLLLIAMIARADRHGRGMARASMLRVAAFDGLEITDEQTEAMIRALPGLMEGSQFELLVYTVDRNPYYAFPRWFETQNMQYVPKTSRYPAPPDVPDHDPPTPPQGRPDGSADLPPERTSAPTTVPTSGETPAEEPRSEGPADQQESADLPAIERARRSREYREYEQVCRDAELDRWLSPLAFEQLFGETLAQGIEDWTVLIEVVKEAARSAGSKAPNVRYGVAIIQGLPKTVKTRADAKAHFDKPRDKPKQSTGRQPEKPAGSNVRWKSGQKPPGYYDVSKKFDNETA